MGKQGGENTDALLGIARDAMASGQLVKATMSVIALASSGAALSAAERVDLLERSCVYGPCALVDFVWEQLGPFAYAGWSLALALRCAREDVARDLMGRGVRLMADVPQGQKYQAIAQHEVSLSRFDLTEGSPSLFLTTRDRTVCSEVFAPFSGTEQLLGGSFATVTNVAATCDTVGRLAGEGAFDDVEFADLLRAAVVRAEELGSTPDAAQPEAREALLGLAGCLLRQHRDEGSGGAYVELVVANMVRDCIDPSILRFLCEGDSAVFYEALESFPELARNTELVCSLVGCLKPGTETQNEHLAVVLARAGCLKELKMMASWPGALTPRVIERAMEEASAAGHAEVATWLLSQRAPGTAAAVPAAPPEDDLSGLLL